MLKLLTILMVVSDVCPYPMPDVKSSAIELKVKPKETSPYTSWQALIGSYKGYQFDKNKVTFIIKLNHDGGSETDYVSFKTKNVKDTTLKVINEDTMEAFVPKNPVS